MNQGKKKIHNSLFIIHNSSPGMTLIELIVVIVIIGVLAGLLLGAINPIEQVQRARDARRKSDLANVQRALELYYQDKGAYPKNARDVNISTGQSSTIYKITLDGTIENIIDWGSEFSPYMGKLPRDVDTFRTYIYYSPRSDNQQYYLYASLERGMRDSQVCKKLDGTACTNVPSGVSCGTRTEHVCNYGVSSPNTSP